MIGCGYLLNMVSDQNQPSAMLMKYQVLMFKIYDFISKNRITIQLNYTVALVQDKRLDIQRS